MRILKMNNELFLNNDYVNELCGNESIEQVIPYLLSLLPLEEIPRTKMSDTCVESLRQDSDSIHAFISKLCEEDSSAYVSKDDLYGAYSEYCIGTGREAHKKHGFMRALRSLGYTEARIGKSREPAWKGLKIK